MATLEQLLATLVKHQTRQIVQDQFKEAIDEIGTFDGNPSLLHDFITSISAFHQKLVDDRHTEFIPKFLNAIKNSKITGKAALRVRQANCKTFEEIKKILLDTYTDNRPIESYIITMVEAKPYGKTAFEYLEYLEKLRNQALNQARIIEPTVSTLASGIIEGTAVKCFQKSIPDPLKTHIYASRSKTLSEIKATLRDHFFQEASRTITKIENSQPSFQSISKQKPEPSNPHKTFQKPFYKQPQISNFKANSNAMSTRTTNTLRTLHNTEEILLETPPIEDEIVFDSDENTDPPSSDFFRTSLERNGSKPKRCSNIPTLELHNVDQTNLPYILLKNGQIKVLIDSGSEKSYISSEIAYNHYTNKIFKSPLNIRTATGTTSLQHAVYVPAPKLFHIKTNLLFHVFDFNPKYDILFGIDTLRKLDLNAFWNNKTLQNQYTSIPLQFMKPSQNNLLNIEVKPFSEQIIEIEIPNTKNGQAIIPQIQVEPNLFIQSGITTVRNYKALCSISNLSSRSYTVEEIPRIISYDPNDMHFSETLPVVDLHSISTEIEKPIEQLIRTDHMNPEQKVKITQLCTKYSSLFHKNSENLTFSNVIKHTIPTTDNNPVYTKTYRYPHIHKEEVQRQIQELLKNKIIRPSHSPWSSPLWIVPKKLDASGKQKWRIVIDYRKLNEKTIGDRYPLPNITDILDKLGKCHHFSTLDLASGFHQIEIDEKSIPKTAFNTEQGHFEFVRLPFGLSSAPATFQRVMDIVLKGLINKICVVYLDDILIFSTSLEEHLEHLTLVFERLRESNLKIQLDKSEFIRRDVEFLGHIITPEGIKPNKKKIEAIENFPLPRTQTQIKSFLGLIGYYRKFISHFSDLTHEFTKRLKKNCPMNLTDPKYLEAFETCKQLLSNDPILQYPDFNQEFQLTTDASNFALGAVLSQNDKPIAYASRTLNDAEKRYSTIERETLAIVWACKNFRPYLFGRKFKIYSDHKPLQWLFSLKDPSSKLLRWRLKLEEYDYQLIYKQGKFNTNADALSRVEIHQTETNDQTEETDDLLSLYPNYDPQELLSLENLDLPDIDSPDTVSTVHSNQSDPVTGIPTKQTAINYSKNQIVFTLSKETVLTPEIKNLFGTKQRYTFKISPLATMETFVSIIKEYISLDKKYSVYFPSGNSVDSTLDPELLYILLSRTLQTHFRDTLAFDITRCTQLLKDIEDEEEQLEIIRSYHNGPNNHRGITETDSHLKRKYYWPNMRKQISKVLNNCQNCLKVKYDRTPINPPMCHTPTPKNPFETLHIDTYTIEKTKFLSIIDSFSKFAQMYPLTHVTAQTVCSKLLDYFNSFGIAKTIIADSGTELKNKVIQEALQTKNISIHYISVNHPQSNGVVERFHSTLLEHIKLLRNQFPKTKIDEIIKLALIAYNNSIHSATKFTPFEIIFNKPFDFDTKNISNPTDYVCSLQETSQKFKDLVYENIEKNKTTFLERVNKNRKNPPELPPQIQISNNRRNKLVNKFAPVSIIDSDPKTHTVTVNKTGNSKIHVSCVKQPRKFQSLVTDAQASRPESN